MYDEWMSMKKNISNCIMKTSTIALCVLAFSLLVLPGCSDTPSSLGIGLIPQEDFLKADTLTAYSTLDRSYLTRRNLGTSRTLAVGWTGGLEAQTLMRFLGIPDSMKGSTVNSVDLILFPNYIAGNSTGTVSFNVHQLTCSWSESGFTWDSLTTLSYDGATIGSFSGAVADSDSVVVSISPQLISTWFANTADVLPIYGILLKSDAPVAGTVIRGFESFEATRVPRLRIIATQNSQIDTFVLTGGYDTFVLNGSAMVDPAKYLYAHPTIGYNGMLLFDVSAVPRNAVIHKATMELTRNPDYLIYSRPAIDSIMATFIVDSMARSDLYESYPPISTRTGNVYSLNISKMVQRWVKGFPNQGVRVKAYDDYIGSSAQGTVNPFVFYNSQSDAALRPRLKIIYSIIQ
jgi:hypothetical protein